VQFLEPSIQYILQHALYGRTSIGTVERKFVYGRLQVLPAVIFSTCRAVQHTAGLTDCSFAIVVGRGALKPNNKFVTMVSIVEKLITPSWYSGQATSMVANAGSYYRPLFRAGR
jgi:hypothetical protein